MFGRLAIVERVDSLVIFHLDIIARYQSFFALELGSKPIHVIFHINHLVEGKTKTVELNRARNTLRKRKHDFFLFFFYYNTHPEQAALFKTQFVGRRGFEIVFSNGFHHDGTVQNMYRRTR